MKKEAAKTASLEKTLRDIRAKFGDDSIMRMNETPAVDIESISTGSIGLDYILGIGGLPRGRIVEIFGPEGAGKTTVALHVVAQAQKTGICAYIDVEHAMDPSYAKRIGVEVENLLISQPNGGEEALQIVEALVRTGTVAVIIVDSVAALRPREEMDGEIGDRSMGAQARLMSQAMRMLTGSIAKTKTLVIFINQLRANIGGYTPGGGAPADITSGGKALKYAATVRIEIRRIASIKKGEDVIGSRVRVKVPKNKVAPPFQTTDFDILYGEGISREGEILALGEKYMLISRAGSAYTFGEIKLGRGYDAAREFLKENPNIAVDIVSEIRRKDKTK